MSKRLKYLLAAVVVLLLLFGARMMMNAYVVPVSSMESTILVGDHIMVTPYPDVKRGDIIVFKFPPDARYSYVKRVMGVPGDRLKICKQAGLSERQADHRAV